MNAHAAEGAVSAAVGPSDLSPTDEQIIELHDSMLPRVEFLRDDVMRKVVAFTRAAIAMHRSVSDNRAAASSQTTEAKTTSKLSLAVIGREHFGNPIPQAWYAAAHDLLADVGQAAAEPMPTSGASKEVRYLLNHCLPVLDRHCAKSLAKEVRDYLAAPAAPAAPANAQGWISADERLPDNPRDCLAVYVTPAGRQRRIRAYYAKQFEIEANGDECDSETREEDDTEWLKAGWYECIDNWGEYSSVTVTEGVVTHWMPLPDAPQQTGSAS